MKWLKNIGSFLWIMLAGIGAVLLLRKPDKWQKKAVDIEEGEIIDDLHLAEIANKAAKGHDDAAHKIKAEAEKEGERESTADIVDQFRNSG